MTDPIVELNLVQHAMEQSLSLKELRFCHKHDVFVDQACDRIVIRLSAYVYQRGPSRVEETFSVSYPEDWWQAFRARFWDSWWFKMFRAEHHLPRYRVERKTLAVDTTVLFPELRPLDMPKVCRIQHRTVDTSFVYPMLKEERP